MSDLEFDGAGDVTWKLEVFSIRSTQHGLTPLLHAQSSVHALSRSLHAQRAAC